MRIVVFDAGERPTEVFAGDRLAFLEKTAGFRRIDLHWCLTPNADETATDELAEVAA